MSLAPLIGSSSRMKFFRERILGIAILALVTSVIAAFLYDYFELKPQRTFYSQPAASAPPTSSTSARSLSLASPARLIPTVAPSFDCTKSTWKSERIVCSSQQLSVLDLAMSNAYRDAAARSPTRAAELRISQNHWLRKIRESCSDITCLQQTYEARILGLGKF